MDPSKNLQQAIASITIWRKGEQRALHKPLLLLYVLACYQHGHSRLFDYGSEIRDNLHGLLERFGPQRAQYRPDMPFWRLQGDGFWELQNAERCSTAGSSRQPPAGELLEYNVAGGFDEQHYALLIKSRNLINVLAQQILEANFTESIQEELADELGFDIRQIRKQCDPLFRQQVLRAYSELRVHYNLLYWLKSGRCENDPYPTPEIRSRGKSALLIRESLLSLFRQLWKLKSCTSRV